MSDAMVREIEHAAIAVRDVTATLARYAALGFAQVRVEDVPGGIRSHVIRSGTAYLEILESTSDESDLARFLEKHGEGLHHLCLQVEALPDAVEAVAMAGCSLVSDSPVADLRGKRVFVHPATNGGVLIGLVEVDQTPAPSDDG